MGIQSLSWRQSADVEWDGESSYGHRLANIRIEGEEYLVGDTDNCEYAAQISARDYFDEGSFSQSFVLNHIDAERFAEDEVNDDDYYDEEVSNHPSRYIRDDPEGEDGDYTEDQISDAIERLKKEKRNEIENDPFGYLHDMGYTDRNIMSRLSDYVNVNELIEDAVSEDGRAHFLNTYNGIEYSSADLGIIPDMLPEDLKDFLGLGAVEKDDLCYYKV